MVAQCWGCIAMAPTLENATSPRKLERTSTPGIYRRHRRDCGRDGRCDCSYVVVQNNKAETFATKAEAREGKNRAQRRAKLSRSHAAGLHREDFREACPDCERELEQRRQTEPNFHTFALDWVERYQGTGRKGYREETRDEDRRLLRRYALKYFSPDLRVTEIGPREIAGFVDWLVKQPSRRRGTLSDSSVRNALQPVSACLATARREGVIAHNPCRDATLPHRPTIEQDEDLPRPFPGSRSPTSKAKRRP